MSYNNYNWSPYFQPQNEQNVRNQEAFPGQGASNGSYQRPVYTAVNGQQQSQHVIQRSGEGMENTYAYAGQPYDEVDNATNYRFSNAGSVPHGQAVSRQSNPQYATNARSSMDTSALGSLAYASSLGQETRDMAPPAQDNSSTHFTTNAQRPQSAAGYSRSPPPEHTLASASGYEIRQTDSRGPGVSQGNSASRDLQTAPAVLYASHSSVNDRPIHQPGQNYPPLHAYGRSAQELQYMGSQALRTNGGQHTGSIQQPTPPPSRLLNGQSGHKSSLSPGSRGSQSPAIATRAPSHSLPTSKSETKSNTLSSEHARNMTQKPQQPSNRTPFLGVPPTQSNPPNPPNPPRGLEPIANHNQPVQVGYSQGTYQSIPDSEDQPYQSALPHDKPAHSRNSTASQPISTSTSVNGYGLQQAQSEDVNYSITVDPSQVFNHHEYQRLQALAASQAEAARNVAHTAEKQATTLVEALNNVQSKGQSKLKHSTPEAGPSDRQSDVPGAEDGEQIEAEMISLLEKMRQYKAKDPSKFAKIWEQVKKVQPPNGLSSQAPVSAKESSQHPVLSPNHDSQASKGTAPVNEKHPNSSLALDQAKITGRAVEAELPDLGKFPALRRKVEKPNVPSKLVNQREKSPGEISSQQKPLSTTEATVDSSNPAINPTETPAIANTSFARVSGNSIHEVAESSEHVPSPHSHYHSSIQSESRTQFHPQPEPTMLIGIRTRASQNKARAQITTAARPANPQAPSTHPSAGHISGETVWPEKNKAALASAAHKALHSQNGGAQISAQEIHNLLDQNPSYTELCETLNAKGFVIDRARFARILLAAVPDMLTIAQRSSQNTSNGVKFGNPRPKSGDSHDSTNSPNLQNEASSVQSNGINIPYYTSPLPTASSLHQSQDQTYLNKPLLRESAGQDSAKQRNDQGSKTKPMSSNASVTKKHTTPADTVITVMNDELSRLSGLSKRKRASLPGSAQVSEFSGFGLLGAPNAILNAVAQAHGSSKQSRIVQWEDKRNISIDMLKSQGMVDQTGRIGYKKLQQRPVHSPLPPTKRELARKRNFSDIVDLTQDLSDDDRYQSPKVPRLSESANKDKSASSLIAETTQDLMNHPDKFCGVLLENTPTSIQSTTINKNLDLSLYKFAPAAPPLSSREDLRSADIVLPLNKKKDALRRSTYNIKTIARDILIASGRHPNMGALNYHLKILRKNFRAVDNTSDLSTLRWDLIDPGGEAASVSLRLENTSDMHHEDDEDNSTMMVTRQVTHPTNRRSTGQRITSTVNGSAASEGIDLVIMDGPMKNRPSSPRGQRSRRSNGGIHVRPNDSNPSGNVGPGISQSTGSLPTPVGGTGTHRVSTQQDLSRLDAGASSTPQSSANTSRGNFERSRPALSTGVTSARTPTPTHTHAQTRKKSTAETGKTPKKPETEGSSMPTPKRGRPPGSKSATPRPQGSSGISVDIPARPHMSNTTPARPSGLRHATLPSDGIAIIIDDSRSLSVITAATADRKRKSGSREISKRRGRPSKDREPPDPKHRIYKCRWKGCPHELHNLETLRKHVRKHRKSAEDGTFSCLWADCSTVVMSRGRQNESGTNVRQPLDFSTEESWDRHMDKKHVDSLAWQFGDGPATHPSDAEASDYMSDAQGRRITPIASTNGPPDALLLSSHPRSVRAYHKAQGNKTEAEKTQAILASKQERRRVIGPGIEREGSLLATPEKRAISYDDASSIQVLSEDEDM